MHRIWVDGTEFRWTQEAERETLAAKRKHGEIERKLAAIVRAIEDGAYTPALKTRLTTLELLRAARPVF